MTRRESVVLAALLMASFSLLDPSDLQYTRSIHGYVFLAVALGVLGHVVWKGLTRATNPARSVALGRLTPELLSFLSSVVEHHEYLALQAFDRTRHDGLRRQWEYDIALGQQLREIVVDLQQEIRNGQ